MICAKNPDFSSKNSSDYEEDQPKTQVMDEFRADLHCHSIFSDGTDTPEQLCFLAEQAGLQGLSITDHDTVAAYTKGEWYTQKRSLFILPGVEFSAMLREEPVHILGYAFSLKSESIQNLCMRHKRRRQERNLQMLERLRGLGYPIDPSEFLHKTEGTWGRPHIADALVKRGIVPTIQTAFDLYLGEGKPAYVKGESITVEETVHAIQAGGGKAVLAHPHLIKKSTTLRTLLTMPFDGLECYYARLGPDQEKKWLELAKQRNWLITGGSDYHGRTKPHSLLGSSWVGQETFALLYNHYLKNSLRIK